MNAPSMAPMVPCLVTQDLSVNGKCDFGVGAAQRSLGGRDVRKDLFDVNSDNLNPFLSENNMISG